MSTRSSTERFLGNDGDACARCRPSSVETRREDGRMRFAPVAGQRFELEADLVLLAMGFLGPERAASCRSSASS